jgi:uracil DNA glycosylase
MSNDDPLELAPLFEGGGEAWLPLLKSTIEAQPGAAQFIGPSRGPTVVPVRELTFQALKPNPPGKWRVVAFGQNPYPRVESATGIAMFDNAFGHWKEPTFGRVTSIRCILTAACIQKFGIDVKTKTADIRALLAKEQIVQPPEWFQSMLTQGVLLLNASLTANSDQAMSTAQHTAFWKPVVQRIVREILAAKHANQEGVVFAWWGAHARKLRPMVEALAKKFPDARIAHIDHCNPAAMGDAFCKGEPHFRVINEALEKLGMTPIDWLPKVGWNAGAGSEATRMGDFIATTMDLHKTYLERLQDVEDIVAEALGPITGIGALPLLPFPDAVAPVAALLKKGLVHPVKMSLKFGAELKNRMGLSIDEVAALYLYTTQSPLYRRLNETLRDPKRVRAEPYFPYLRLFLEALKKLKSFTGTLYRGVALDLRAQYPKGETVTWWGVSSCTPSLAVAKGFLGSGARTLFEVHASRAVGVKRYSCYQQEDEYLLLPGTQLAVVDVSRAGRQTTVHLEELPTSPLVA